MKALLFTGVLLAAACATPRAAAGDDRDESGDQKPKQVKAGAADAGAVSSSGPSSASMFSFDMTSLAAQAAHQANSIREAQAACEMEIPDRLSAPQLILLSRERTTNFLKETGPKLEDAAATKELSRIGERVSSGVADLHFGLVTSSKLRAFSASDGTVLVTTALVKKCANEAQLAAVLAHEVDHVRTRADEAPRIKSLRAQCQATRVMKDAMPNMVPKESTFTGAMGSLENFMRGGEPEADEAALKAVSAAGYEPSEYEALITALGDTNQDGLVSPGSAELRASKLKAQREALGLKTGKKPALPKSLSAL